MKNAILISLLAACMMTTSCDVQYDVPPSLQSALDPYFSSSTTTTPATTDTPAATDTPAPTTTAAAPAQTQAPAKTKAPTVTTKAPTVTKTSAAPKQTTIVTTAPTISTTKAPVPQTTVAAPANQPFSRNALPKGFSSKLSIVADRVVAIPGEQKVPFRLMIFGNTDGFSMCGIRLNYDGNVPPIYNLESRELTATPGSLIADTLAVPAVSPQKNRIAYAIAGTNNILGDGILYTCYFNIPETAKAGDVYQITAEVDNIKKDDGTALKAQTYSGFIVIE